MNLKITYLSFLIFHGGRKTVQNYFVGWNHMHTDIFINLAASAACVSVAMLVLWAISLKIKDVSIIDMFWGAGFGLIALLCLAMGEMFSPYVFLLAALPVIWSIRYTIYIVRRNWGHGEDKRYQAIRANVSARKWPFYALRVVFFNQGLAMLLVAAPIWVGVATAQHFQMYHPEHNPDELISISGTEIGALAVIGTIIWLIGFLFEAIGDFQLSRFLRRRKEVGAEVTGKVMDKGLWRFTRHPNYFGNAMMWWGIWLVACQAPWGWATIVSPVFMTYALVKLTGAAVLEKSMAQRPEYADYMARTSGFMPWFPKKG